MRQEIAYFDNRRHSTGVLMTMLSTEATAMSGLSGVNLGSILTVLVNLTSGTIVAYVLETPELTIELPLVGNWPSLLVHCYQLA